MNTIKDEIINSIVIKKSTFITKVCHKENIEEAKDYINSIKAEYPDATHHPAAYIIGSQGEFGHASDDGEPSKTAGSPIFDVLRKNNLTNVVAVVVRYFGGIKLGAGGLVRAYSKSTAEALKQATLLPIIEYSFLNLTFDYPSMPAIEPLLSEFRIINRQFTDNISFDIELPTIKMKQFMEDARNLTQGKIIITKINEPN